VARRRASLCLLIFQRAGDGDTQSFGARINAQFKSINAGFPTIPYLHSLIWLCGVWLAKKRNGRFGGAEDAAGRS
jgi:hypothetical protein